jgi:hypothetical protein
MEQACATLARDHRIGSGAAGRVVRYASILRSHRFAGVPLERTTVGALEHRFEPERRCLLQRFVPDDVILRRSQQVTGLDRVTRDVAPHSREWRLYLLLLADLLHGCRRLSSIDLERTHLE